MIGIIVEYPRHFNHIIGRIDNTDNKLKFKKIQSVNDLRGCCFDKIYCFTIPSDYTSILREIDMIDCELVTNPSIMFSELGVK